MTHIEAAAACNREIESAARAYNRRYKKTRKWNKYDEVAEDEMSLYPELTDSLGQVTQTTPHPARTADTDTLGQVVKTGTDTDRQVARTDADNLGQVARTKTDRQTGERTDKAKTRRTWWQRLKWPTIDTVRAWAFDIIMLSIVGGHAILVWYDCADRWGMPGKIGGAVAFLIVCGAVLISTDSSKSQTNTLAVFFVGIMDLAAYWLHKPVFLDASNNMGEGETTAFCIFICASSFTALFLFRHSKN